MAAAIVADVEEQLAVKGLKRVDTAPDLYVHYHVKQRDDVKITDWDEGKFKLENRKVTEKWAKVGHPGGGSRGRQDRNRDLRGAASGTLKPRP